ncbi:MAG TPA: SEC-C metal-binding domain-containing protein [Blastocatellia bacterium]|nr:SEC-C metal-binding domain-containing protein [Blastocatellia bacterium]
MSTSLRPSSSSSPQEFSSSGSIASQFSAGPHKWLRLLLAGAICYLVLLPLWLVSLRFLAAFSGMIAGFFYHLFDAGVATVIDGKLIKVVVTAARGSGFEGQSASTALQIDRVTYGLPMLVALVLITRSSIASKLKSLGLGVGLMLLMTVLAVMLFIKMSAMHVEDQISGSIDRTAFFFYLFHGYAFSQPVVAVLIWAGLLLTGALRPKPESTSVADAGAARVRNRNALCACGSGRKYKKCCGRSPASKARAAAR